jgi:hypothetical protein|tara:strand:- start:112 stop:1047 length:936 start_codon:yes stop_codon:yes gene_type:complete
MAQEKSNTHEQEDGQVDLEFDGYEETTVDLPSEGKDETSGVEIEPEAQAKSDDSDDEHSEVSKNVQKRIDRLTKKMRDAERREQEAINYAKNVHTESQSLKSKLQTVDDGYMNEYGHRIDIEQQQVEAQLKQAMNNNDPDKVIESQRKLTQLAVAAEKYSTVKQANAVRNKQTQEQQTQAQAQPQPAAPPPPPVEQPPDPKAEKWASENDWFGKDEAMTFAAFGIHKKMVESEGFDPQSDDYYDELNGRIRGKFPQEFNNGSGKKPVQNVAGNSRSRSKGRSKQVRLTQSQVAIANKLGVPLEEYAKYVKT